MKKDIMVIRDSIAKIVSMLTNQSIKVTMRGSRAYVAYHPKTGKITGMNIPFIPDDASDEFIAAIQGFLDHEVGHVLYSDFEALKAANLLGKRVANLANIIEDVFVERKMTEGFRGSGLNLESVRHFYLEKIARVKIDTALKAGDIEAARGYATVAAFRAWGGQASATDFIKDPKIAELIKPVAEKLGEETMAKIGLCNNSNDCLELAKICKTKLEKVEKVAPPAPPPPPPPEPESDDKDEDDMLDKMKGAGDLSDAVEAAGEEDDEKHGPEDVGTSKVTKDDSGKSGADPDELDDSDAGEDEDPGDDSCDPDAPKGEGEDADEKEPAADPEAEFGDTDTDTEDEKGVGAEGKDDDDSREPGEAGMGSGEDPGEDSGATDPLADMLDDERDFDEDIGKALSESAGREIKSSDYAVFSNEWDQIIPARLAKHSTSVDAMEAGIRDHIGVMQKTLERAMAAKARKAWNPGMRRGRIAPGSLFKTSVGDDRVFRQRFETKAKNTAVSLVIDCSGSMSCGRINIAAVAAFALASVMERLKLTYEVLGFTTGNSGEMVAMMAADAEQQGASLSSMGWSRCEPLYIPIFKSFNGTLDSAARSRLAHLTEYPGWLNQNVDGESVQIAARRLLQQRADRRVMMVLSDGSPAAACAVGLDAHLKKVVAEATAQGVEVIGIGIQTNSVKRYYPKHVVLNKVEDLPAQVVGELTKILLAP